MLVFYFKIEDGYSNTCAELRLIIEWQKILADNDCFVFQM